MQDFCKAQLVLRFFVSSFRLRQDTTGQTNDQQLRNLEMYLDSLKEHETILKTSKEKWFLQRNQCNLFVCVVVTVISLLFFINKNIKDYLETNTKAVEFGV